MPLPKPHAKEDEQEFVSRCISIVVDDGTVDNTADGRAQAAAMCFDAWRNRDKGSGKIERAYSLLEIKSIEEDLRIIHGIASTPETDLMDDVVEPHGASFKLPIPFLFQHDSKQPIGHVRNANVTDEGIAVEVKLAKVDEPGKLKDRLDEAWQSIKAGLVRGLSIGFKDLESEPIEGSVWGRRITKWSWLELSAVTIAANASASITTIKEIDHKLRAASGASEASGVPGNVKSNPAGVTASRKTAITFKGPKQMAPTKPLGEQIVELEAKRAADEAARLAIQNKANAENRTKDEGEREEFANLSAEIEGIDAELKDLRLLEKSNVAQARPVQGDTPQKAVASRGSTIIQTKPNRPVGIGFARIALSKMASYKTQKTPEQCAREIWPSDPDIADSFSQKTAVAHGTSYTSGWASQLVVATNLPGEFVEFLRPMTLIGRIAGLRRVPFNITIPRQTAGVAGQWVGEGKAKPLGKPTLDQITLRFHKSAVISVFTEELARFSNPAVEQLVRDDLAGGIAQFLDEQFCNPSVSAVANVNPASITNGADTAAASGDTLDLLVADALTAFANFQSSEIPIGSVAILMQPSLALQINMMRNALGQFMFPSIDQNGGKLFGCSVYTSTSVGSGRMIFVAPSEILLADDGGVSVDVSNQASLQMDDAPTAGAQSLVSLFQTNQIAVRAEREITWAVRRDNAVYYITSADYGAGGTS